MLSVVWGTVGEWVAGVATSFAVIVALVTSVRAERAQREASLGAVYAWATKDVDGDWALHVRNETRRPLFRWSVHLAWPTGSSDLDQDVAGIIPPGDFEFDWEPESDPTSEAAISVTIRFADALDRLNERSATGRLRRVRSTERLHG